MDFLPIMNWGMVSLLSGLGLGWYLRGRGLAGVEMDIGNIKQDLVKMKNYFTPAPGVVSAPVQVTPAS